MNPKPLALSPETYICWSSIWTCFGPFQEQQYSHKQVDGNSAFSSLCIMHRLEELVILPAAF